MQLHRTLLATLALCAAAAMGPPALASTDVVYSFTGVVDADEADRGWTTFSGHFTFDSLAIDQIADPSTADYKMNGLPYGMQIVFDDGTSVTVDDVFDILVTNDLGGADQFGALAQRANASDTLGLALYDFTQAAFASDALPLPPGGLTLAWFSASELRYASGSGVLNGHLTGLSCQAGCGALVPEPQTGGLLLAGLGVLGFLARRHRAA